MVFTCITHRYEEQKIDDNPTKPGPDMTQRKKKRKKEKMI